MLQIDAKNIHEFLDYKEIKWDAVKEKIDGHPNVGHTTPSKGIDKII